MGYVLGILAALFVFSTVVSLHELGHMLAAKACGVGVVEYSIGLGPVLYTKRFKETVFSVRAIPFGGYCAMVGEESLEASGKDSKPQKLARKSLDFKTDWQPNQRLTSKKWWQKILIYVAGPAMNIVVGVLAALLLVLSGNIAVNPTVDAIKEGYPAASSGIQVGDVLVGVNDRDTLTWSDYMEYMSTHPAETKNGYDIRVRRGEKIFTIHADVSEDDELFGISVKNDKLQVTPSNVMLYTKNQTVYMFRSVFDSLRMLIRGDARLSDLTGVVGMTAMIAEEVDDATKTGTSVFAYIMFILSFISVNLCIMNMLPLPALDGGRTVLAIIEAIIRRPIPERVELAVNSIGMIFLLLLLGWTMVHDLIQTVFHMSA